MNLNYTLFETLPYIYSCFIDDYHNFSRQNPNL